MEKHDYYELLGVSRDADDPALKAAFRKMAMRFHPDRNPGNPEAEARFKQVNEAYDVLKDPQKRGAYDRYGHAAFTNGHGQGGNGFDFGSSFSDIFEDLFGEFTGRRRRQQGGERGSDLRYDLEINLETAYRGAERTITIETSVACDDCKGSGAAAGARPETCGMCGGAGKLRSTQGFFMVERACPQCHGHGQVIKDPCRTCQGRGAVEKTRTLVVKIPPGVDQGTRIRLSGEGAAGRGGGPAGDLYIFIAVAEHPLFLREGTQIGCRLPLAMTAAALGGEVEVPTIDGGRAKLKIPAGSQTGRQFRLKGKGMPQLGASGLYGDMVIVIEVETPVNLSARQKQLLREFAEQGDNDTSPNSTGFFARMREVWDGLTE